MSMTDAKYLQRFTPHTAAGSFYVREQATGRRTRLYINLEACGRAVERGELYTDAEYERLTAATVGAAPRRATKRRAA